MKLRLLAAPLQGLTDFPFRQLFQKYFGAIDSYYAPYIRIRGKLELKESDRQDIAPENNSSINLIPQIMAKSAQKFLYVAEYVKKLGYRELNWNLGCPYPMVTNRGLGAGQIKDIDGIREILDRTGDKISISIKTRLGLDDKNEIFPLLEALENYPIKNIMIHPRIGKQLYKGKVDLNQFSRCLKITSHKLIYNGDINTVTTFNSLKSQFPAMDTWMIGRGIIANPFLPQMIRKNTGDYPENKTAIFRQFHHELVEYYVQKLSGDKHVILKMSQYWQYWKRMFPDSRKLVKRIKKSKSLTQYYEAVYKTLPIV